MIKLNFKQLVYGFTLFAVSLCLIRIFKSEGRSYIFLFWNLFLAYVPWWISNYFKQKNALSAKDAPLLLVWLLFLPNAPYMLTDLFHLRQRPSIPLWFDLVLILSFAFIGLLIFYRSLRDMTNFFRKYMSPGLLTCSIYAVFWLISFGLYLGRFLRFNSWDILHPLSLGKACFRLLLDERTLKDVTAFTLIFSAFLMFLFFMITHLDREEKPVPKAL
jgi:uncharacterized membrane protein